MKRFLSLLLAQWPLWAVVFGPTLVLAVTFVGVIAWTANDYYEPDCEAQVTSSISSPEVTSSPSSPEVLPHPMHVAVARNEKCFGTGIGGSEWQVQCVHVVDEGVTLTHKNEAFCIHDYDGGPRLAMQWLSPQRLQITAPNTAIIALRRRGYDGVHIDVKFDPDDPAARKEWLRSQGRTDR